MGKTGLWMSGVAIAAVMAGCGGNTERTNDNATANQPGTAGAAATSGARAVDGGRTMTLRGCVQAGQPAGTYVLKVSGEADRNERGAAGTSGGAQGSGETNINGTRSGADAAGSYHLIPTGNLDIQRNLGKEVTVTGEIATQARDDTVGTTGPVGGREGQAGAQSEGGDRSAGQRAQRPNTGGEGDAAKRPGASSHFFRVTSMNKVADSCRAEESR